MTPGRGFNLVALATLAAQVVIVDGPLLQRASTVVSIQVTKPVNVTAAIAQEIPYGYTGYGFFSVNSSYFGGPAIMVMNATFADIFNQYVTRAPITTTFTGCVGSCVGTIKAAGLALECSHETALWSNIENVNNETTVFASNFEWLPAQHLGEMPDPAAQIDPATLYPYISFNLSYAIGRIATPSLSPGLPYGAPQGSQVPWQCNGTMVTKRCSMRSATLDYPVTLVNNTIHLSGNSSSFTVDHIQAVGNISTYFDDHDPDIMTFTTLGGIAIAAQNMFNSRAVQGQGVSLTGSLASQYIDYGTGSTNYFINQDACAINWADPSDDVINALNELMFRTSLIASNVSKYALMNDSFDSFTNMYEAFPVNIFAGDTGMPEPQMVEMEQTSNVTVFQSNFSYLAAALAAMMVGFSVVLPTLYGFWEMGRRASLNPLEIGKAFNADLLHEQSSNIPAHRLAKAVGNRTVKYGEIIEDYQDLGGNGLGLRHRASRLGIADSARVKKPGFRALYN